MNLSDLLKEAGAGDSGSRAPLSKSINDAIDALSQAVLAEAKAKIAAKAGLSGDELSGKGPGSESPSKASRRAKAYTRFDSMPIEAIDAAFKTNYSRYRETHPDAPDFSTVHPDVKRFLVLASFNMFRAGMEDAAPVEDVPNSVIAELLGDLGIDPADIVGVKTVRVKR